MQKATLKKAGMFTSVIGLIIMMAIAIQVFETWGSPPPPPTKTVNLKVTVKNNTGFNLTKVNWKLDFVVIEIPAGSSGIGSLTQYSLNSSVGDNAFFDHSQDMVDRSINNNDSFSYTLTTPNICNNCRAALSRLNIRGRKVSGVAACAPERDYSISNISGTVNFAGGTIVYKSDTEIEIILSPGFLSGCGV
jgi:hypothetical protein